LPRSHRPSEITVKLRIAAEALQRSEAVVLILALPPLLNGTADGPRGVVVGMGVIVFNLVFN
jgi:hypothetical protein